jgi:alpha-tubulin suppressor-like RCC1 family protein
MDGSVWCWGFNGNGQVGNNSTTNVHSPVMITSGAQHIATGDIHTCAIKADGVYCWGDNGSGELGDGTYMGHLQPTQVGMAGATEIAVGNVSACALVNNQVLCWGEDAHGQLGDGVVDWLTIRGVNLTCP